MKFLPPELTQLPPVIQEQETSEAIDKIKEETSYEPTPSDIDRLVTFLIEVETQTARTNIAKLIELSARRNPSAVATRAEEILRHALRDHSLSEHLFWALVAAVSTEPTTATDLLDQLSDELVEDDQQRRGFAVFTYYTAATAETPSTRARMRLRSAGDPEEQPDLVTAEPALTVAAAIVFDKPEQVRVGTESLLRTVPETDTRLLRNVQIFLSGEAAANYPDTVADVIDTQTADDLFEWMRANPKSYPVAFAVTRLMVATGDERLRNRLRDITDDLVPDVASVVITLLDRIEEQASSIDWETLGSEMGNFQTVENRDDRIGQATLLYRDLLSAESYSAAIETLESMLDLVDRSGWTDQATLQKDLRELADALDERRETTDTTEIDPARIRVISDVADRFLDFCQRSFI